MILRALAVLVGIALLTATAHVTVLATGGYYDNPHAILVMAIAGGVGLGALCLGRTWVDRRYFLAVVIGVALLSGEAFGLLQTGERLIASRDAAQKPAQQAREARERVQRRITAVQADLAALGTSERLQAALKAKAKADQAVIDQASLRGCASNCRKLLTKQVEAAAAEVAEARKALHDQRGAASGRLRLAQAELASIQLLASGNGLAERLGQPAWILDLISAALGSLGINGLGCALLAFGAHGARREVAIEAVLPVESASRSELDHAAQFGCEKLAPAEGGYVPLDEVHAAYRSWCRQIAKPPLPAKQIGAALSELFSNAGIKVGEVEGRIVALNVTINPPQLVIEDKREAA